MWRVSFLTALVRGDMVGSCYSESCVSIRSFCIIYSDFSSDLPFFDCSLFHVSSYGSFVLWAELAGPGRYSGLRALG